ncbi:hypothetical protein P389DRAFT_197375 [Cystobasidium minutum MCA 4210]|uniref:uncharacterized protein n=1 Tax=Cystobasidium minutum MCA 4210 TaxID=1397322 RepID=UPI0034CFDEBA|eukprot:jgi/Rhomi1/197375/gm1.5589_g
MSDELDESPLAGRAYEEAASGSTSSNSGNPSERHIGGSISLTNDDEDGEDVPNWIAFADFAKSQNKDKSNPIVSTPAANPVIPKRGEKDFEPASVDRYIDLQQSLLETSRAALFSAISSGVRSHTSKSPNRAIWDPLIERAYMVPVADPALPPSDPINREILTSNENASAGAVHGVHFLTMGAYDHERKRMELMPEEALYLIERGSIECWTSDVNPTVPMSVQHAWSIMICAAEMTPERYQVYAFLKRLGYTVVRSGASPSPMNELTSDNTLKLYDIIDLARSFISRLFTPISLAFTFLKNTIAPYTLSSLERLNAVAKGYRTSLVGQERWFTYDQVFSSLQFVKAGSKADIGINKRRMNPYRVFFNVYKPVTKYKKTNPPPPDFRIGAISAQTTAMPDLWDFQNIFAELDEMPTPSHVLMGVQSSITSIWHYVTSYFQATNAAAHLPTAGKKSHNNSSNNNNRPRRPAQPSLTRPAPYAKLKNGSKSAIIAVVDNGTVSFQRFGESDFQELPWVGGDAL